MYVLCRLRQDINRLIHSVKLAPPRAALGRVHRRGADDYGRGARAPQDRPDSTRVAERFLSDGLHVQLTVIFRQLLTRIIFSPEKSACVSEFPRSRGARAPLQFGGFTSRRPRAWRRAPRAALWLGQVYWRGADEERPTSSISSSRRAHRPGLRDQQFHAQSATAEALEIRVPSHPGAAVLQSDGCVLGIGHQFAAGG